MKENAHKFLEAHTPILSPRTMIVSPTPASITCDHLYHIFLQSTGNAKYAKHAIRCIMSDDMDNLMTALNTLKSILSPSLYLRHTEDALYLMMISDAGVDVEKVIEKIADAIVQTADHFAKMLITPQARINHFNTCYASYKKEKELKADALPYIIFSILKNCPNFQVFTSVIAKFYKRHTLPTLPTLPISLLSNQDICDLRFTSFKNLRNPAFFIEDGGIFSMMIIGVTLSAKHLYKIRNTLVKIAKDVTMDQAKALAELGNVYLMKDVEQNKNVIHKQPASCMVLVQTDETTVATLTQQYQHYIRLFQKSPEDLPYTIFSISKNCQNFDGVEHAIRSHTLTSYITIFSIKHVDRLSIIMMINGKDSVKFLDKIKETLAMIGQDTKFNANEALAELQKLCSVKKDAVAQEHARSGR